MREQYDTTIEVEAREFGVWTTYDETGIVPWEWQDTYGTISDWRQNDYHNRPQKYSYERVLVRDTFSSRLYDYCGAIQKARKEGLTGAEAKRVVDAEFKYLQDWCEDRWHYIDVGVAPLDDDDNPICDPDWVGGVEDIGDYWKEVAKEIAGEFLYREQKEQEERAFALHIGIPTVA